MPVAERGIATLRYQFLYMEKGVKRPDPPRFAHAVVRSVAAQAALLAPDLPLFAGGRSFGGRMTSQTQAETPLPEVRGLAFLGFPLYPEGKPGVERAEHLARVAAPMLFVSGARDALAQVDLLKSMVGGLGGRATLRMIDHTDHSCEKRENVCRCRGGGARCASALGPQSRLSTHRWIRRPQLAES